jgi:primosomal protein N' (replication factor Y)
LKKKSVHAEVKGLVSKGVALYFEELQQSYKPKIESFIQLHEFYKEKQNLKILFEELSRAKKQVDCLMQYTQLVHGKEKISKASLIKSGASSNVVNTLIEKEIFIETKEEVSRLQAKEIEELIQHQLNEEQKLAYENCFVHFEAKKPVLLEGVTSSGKTHVYIELIKNTLEKNQQVLFLIPEISLTVQLIQRLQKVFGDAVGVYHSKYNTGERVEIWNKVLNKEYKILVGARSAIFLPYADLGLIIVDEEHDASYKQTDPAPRYQARDAAVVMSHIHDAHILLGSATPSIESYYNATTDKYALVKLKNRYSQVAMPHIHILDMKHINETKQLVSHYSFELINQIKKTIEEKEQVILFQNRRGFSQYITCQTCGWIPKCHQCDVSLTYHKYADYLACHYCGFKTKTKTKCQACASKTLVIKGFGTEKVEDEILEIIPTAKVDRLDVDTVRAKNGHAQVIEKFEDRQTDILIGTQMVTKGLDFSHVYLVGVLLADQLLFYPDFRAVERAFQLLVQVSGRAGRNNKQGQVYIQTFQPNHPVFPMVQKQDYFGFYATEIYNRKQFYYPPYCRLIHLQVKNKEAEIVNNFSAELSLLLKRSTTHCLVLGPTIPPVSRIKNYYLRDIMIKIEKGKVDLTVVKNAIKESIHTILQNKEYKNTYVVIDVDP